MKNIAEKCKYHIIYTITRDDGHFYKGMHSTDNLKDGYRGSGKIVKAWVKKHGIQEFWKRHTKSIDEVLPTRSLLEQREEEIVDAVLMSNPLCMNLSPGGKGGSKFTGKKHTAQARLKMGQANKDKPKSSEHKRAIGQANLGKKKFAGKSHTLQTRTKQSAAMSKSCTVDGINIFPSRRSLIKDLGKGKTGARSPMFRYLTCTSTEGNP